LTAASAPPTKASPVNTLVWASWLGLDTGGDPELEKLVRGAAEFCNAAKARQSPRWLSLMGVTGTGKTHCAKRLWRHLSVKYSWLEHRFQPQEIYWPRFVSELRSGDSFERLRDMMDWPLLFLDDIGAERDTTGFSSEQLNTLLGCRMNRWTILTSNLLPDQLARIEPRLADRIIRAPNILASIKTTSYALRKLQNK